MHMFKRGLRKKRKKRHPLIRIVKLPGEDESLIDDTLQLFILHLAVPILPGSHCSIIVLATTKDLVIQCQTLFVSCSVLIIKAAPVGFSPVVY